MKLLLIVFSFLSFVCSAQTLSGFPNCALKMRSMDYFQLVREVALINQLEKIDVLKGELERSKQNGIISQEFIESKRAENAALKELMQQYIEEINSLNQKNEQLHVTPELAKDPRGVEQIEQIEKLRLRIEDEKRLGVLTPVELNTMEEEYQQLVLKLEELLKEIDGE